MRLRGAAARPARIAAVMALCLGASAADARAADWLITPFVGGSFAPETTFLVVEEGAGRKFTLGGHYNFSGIRFRTE